MLTGLVPAIHVFDLMRRKDVDARDKRGHDDVRPSNSYSFLMLACSMI